MKYYIREIKPYILKKDAPCEILKYDWIPEEFEEEIRKEIPIQRDEKLIFIERYIETQCDEIHDEGYFLGWNECCEEIMEKIEVLTIGD